MCVCVCVCASAGSVENCNSLEKRHPSKIGDVFRRGVKRDVLTAVSLSVYISVALIQSQMMGEMKNFNQILKNGTLFFLYKNALYDNTHWNIWNVKSKQTTKKSHSKLLPWDGDFILLSSLYL